MPKVSDEYIEERKNQIMDCAKELLEEIPLYQIAMRDIIRKMNVSQGLIYRYYSGLDHIFVDLINRETKDLDIKERLEDILNDVISDKEKIMQIFELLGNYLVDIQLKIGSKLYFEILADYSFDEVKQKELLPKIIFNKDSKEAQEKILKYIMEKVESKIFKPSMPLDLIFTYVGVTIDGIGIHLALNGKYNIELVKDDIFKLFKLLAEYIVQCLNIEN